MNPMPLELRSWYRWTCGGVAAVWAIAALIIVYLAIPRDAQFAHLLCLFVAPGAFFFIWTWTNRLLPIWLVRRFPGIESATS
jgi:hypothetical protein